MTDLTREQIEKMEAGPELDEAVHFNVMPDSIVRLKYSTNIAAAWRLVDEFLASGPRGTRKVMVMAGAADMWCGWFERVEPGGGYVQGDGDTAALAICRGRLLAVLTEREGEAAKRG